MNKADEMQPFAVPIPKGCGLVGIGRSTMYKLINKKAVETITIGRRRLLIVASLKRLVSPDTEHQNIEKIKISGSSANKTPRVKHNVR